MSKFSRTFIRTAVAALLVGAAPIASAVGQDIPAAPVQAAAADAPAPAQVQVQVQTPADIMVQQARLIAAEIERDAREAAALEARAEALSPGEFVWQPERAASGEVEVVVSIAAQKAYVYRADKLIGVTTVSTGRRGHSTPTGSFTILQKNRRHFSNLYNNAPMPNMQRLTWDGIALHAGALPGYPASHGCVRLPMEFSRLLFGVTEMGGRVHIVAGTPPTAAGALAFATAGGAVRLASAR